MKKPYIVYSLPKDRTTQKFNKSKFQDILKAIDNFFQNSTTASISGLDTLELTAYASYNETYPSEVLNNIIKKTSKRFGASDKEPVAFHFPSGEPHSTNKYTWSFTKDRFQEVLQYFIEQNPMPKSNFGPLELFFTYHFKLVDPISKNELENQEHISNLLVWFSRSKLCSPTLFYPFENSDKKFWEYIDNIITYLPFQFEEKYLKIANINKQGEVRSFKKIERQ